MRRLAVAVLLLSLAACVTERAPNDPLEPKIDLHEAARINTQLGMEYARNGKYVMALEKLERAVEQDSGYASAHAALALVYAQRGEDDRAEAHFKRALWLDEKDPNTRMNYGVFQCDRGRYAAADELLRTAAADRNFPSVDAALATAGLCARKAGQKSRAEQYFRDSLALNPSQPEVLLQLAALAAERGDWLKVRAFIDRRSALTRPTAESLRLAIAAERALGDEYAARRYEAQLSREFP